LTALEKLKYPCGWDFKDAAGIGTIAPFFDAYLLPRLSWQPEHRHLAVQWFAQLKAVGKTVIYDLDDDLLTPHLVERVIGLGQTEGKSPARLEAERLERVWALQQCDGVTVSTQRLATVVRGYTDRPVVVVPNAIDVPWFRRVLRTAPRQIRGLTIGWAGGLRPGADVEPMAVAWGRLAARYQDVTFVVCGYVPAVFREQVPVARLVTIPWLPIESYPLALAELDIACAAVSDTPFNRCKSVIKAYEASVAGSAVVASPTLYRAVIEHGVNGYLAETADEWETALAELVERPALRRMLATRLLRHVERHCSLRENLWRWPAAWQQIAEDARARRGRGIVVA